MKKSLAISVLLMLLLSVSVISGCNKQPINDPTSSNSNISSNSSDTASNVERINPYDESNFEVEYPHENKALQTLNKLIHGRDISELSGNERFNAELLTFMLADNSTDYYYSDKFLAANANFYNIGEEVNFDLNNDGKNETILVTNFGEDSNQNMQLKINNESITFFSINPLEQFAIVDINTSDSQKEIFICENGPSNDPASFIFSYSNSEIINCYGEQGVPQSIPCNILPYETGIDIDGSGYIKAFKRSDILQTWSFIVQYKLENSRLTQLIPKHGYYATNYPVFMLKPLICYKDMDINSESIVIQDGQAVHITATDNKEWIRITLADETIGWAHLTDYNKIQNGADISLTTDIFWGLLFAD